MKTQVKGMFIGAGIMIVGGIGQSLTKDINPSIWKLCFGLWCVGAVYWAANFIGQIKSEKEQKKREREESATRKASRKWKS